MIICEYFVWFIIYSFMGWVWESIFVTIKGHHWKNRGFLFGPVVPIYGVGALAASILFGSLDFLPKSSYTWYQVFIVSFLGSIVLEYATSWMLEKKYHARWWDYSDQPLNINGRVCLACSLAFGAAGLLVVYIIYPFVSSRTDQVHPLVIEFLALIFMLFLGMDISLTLSSLTDFSRNFERINQEINEQMSVFYDSLEEGLRERKGAHEAAVSHRKTLIEEKITAYLSSANRFSKDRFSQIVGFKHEGTPLELRKKAAEHLSMLNIIDRKKKTADSHEKDEF